MARPIKTPEVKAVYNATDQQGFLFRNFVPFTQPDWLNGETWRRICRSQPVVMDIISTLSMHVHGLPWEIRAVDVTQTKRLLKEIDYHSEIFQNSHDNGMEGYIELLIEDLHMLPFGAATETVRYKPRKGELDDRGKLYKILAVDGATFYPVNDMTGEIVAIQTPPLSKNGSLNIPFNKNELRRIYRFPRPEVQYRGWGMTPVERVYLAVEMLLRGDKYYARLLLDTPEAGLLDLGDMSEDSATKWAANFRIMFSGLDPFKIPVLYGHNTPAKYISFNRPPSELLYNETYERYAQLVAASVGLTLSDIGFKSRAGGAASLAGSIRDERHSRSTGYATIRRLLEKHFTAILPKELKFVYIDVDDEALVAKGRARSTNAIAGLNLVKAGIFTPQRWAKQMEIDGLVTPSDDEPEIEDFEITMQLQNPKFGEETGTSENLDSRRKADGGKVRDETGKEPVKPSSGGMGDVKITKSIFPDEYIGLRNYFVSFGEKLVAGINRARLRKLIKKTLSNFYPVAKSIIELGNTSDANWPTELISYIFDNGDDDLVKKSVSDIISKTDDLFESDDWWKLDFENDDDLIKLLAVFYQRGLTDTAKELQEQLYENDLTATPDIEFNVDLESFLADPAFIARVKDANIIINNGNKELIQRVAASTLFSSQDVATISEIFKSGLTVDELLENEQLINWLTDGLRNNLLETFLERARIITDFESGYFYNLGRISQARSFGVQEKYLVHSGKNEPCEHCLININKGKIPISDEYENKMGGRSQFAPFHPECECITKFTIRGIFEKKSKFLGEK